MNSSVPPSSSPQDFHSEPENIIIQKQRKELQLLIAELKDRDKELNDMVVVHQRQLLTWEDDRQKILTLAERCNRTENELLKRNEMIAALNDRLKFLKSQEEDWKRTLESTRRELQELTQTATDTSFHCQTLEEKNQALNCSVMELSNKVGHLQAREQELLTMLQLKDKDILEATSHITEFTCKFKMLESALRTAKMEGTSISKEKQDFKLKLKEVMLEIGKLKDDLSEKTKENNEQREEIIRLKQENNYLTDKLMFSVERANRKDHLLQSAKSKQLRTDTELSNLRQIYLKQQQDLQFLHFNLESSQETNPKPKKEAHETSIEMVLSDLENSSDGEAVCSEVTHKTHTRFVHFPQGGSQSTCLICDPGNRCQAQDLGSQERLCARLDAFHEREFGCSEALPRQPQAWDSPLSAGRAEVRPASPSDSRWMMDSGEFAQPLERNPVAFLPMHKHWLGLESFAELAKGRSPPSKLSDQFDGGHKAAGTADPIGVPRGQSPQKSPRLAKALDPSCSCRCPASRTSPCQPVTDQEWMQIFKPARAEGETRHGAFLSSPQASCRMKSAKAESSHDVDLTLSDLGAPCLTSTQKMSGPKRQEKLFESDLSPKLTSGPDLHSVNGCCQPAIHCDSCSPTSKLQRLLAESRQMLADLERNYLLHDALSSSLQEGSTSAAGEYPGSLPAAEETQMKLSLFTL
ncbi:coiled-coil domain-containing protein 62 isoform X2 [Paroedura picta]|uniref:coiled-coil domain-containing protein 62 isoform X2 n=1 Tax=Paroedura picta TaxID=143630 RepID=UPI004055CB0C